MPNLTHTKILQNILCFNHHLSFKYIHIFQTPILWPVLISLFIGSALAMSVAMSFKVQSEIGNKSQLALCHIIDLFVYRISFNERVKWSYATNINV